MSNPAQNFYGFDVLGGFYYDGIWYGQIATDLSSTYATTTSLNNYLKASNNLSELTNTSQARDNLGLGTMSTQNSNAYSLVNHTHVISDIDLLQSVLDTKANYSDISGLQADISDLQDQIDSIDNTPSAHTHPISDINGLQSALDDKIAEAELDVILDEFADKSTTETALNGKAPLIHTHVIGDVVNLQATLDGKASTLHTHIISDTIGLQSALNNKATLTHSHVIADTSGLESALNNKSNVGHTHNISDIIGLSANRIVQRVNTTVGTVATGNTIIPDDNTIPQITEGTQFMTLTITPTSASSILTIDVTAHASSSIVGSIGACLFRDNVSDALACGYTSIQVLGNSENIRFSHNMVAGTTSPITFRVRIGSGGALSVVTFNGVGGAGRYGGKIASGITITEFTV